MVVNDNKKSLLRKMDDEEEWLFQLSVTIVSLEQPIVVVPLVDSDVINSDNSSSYAQEGVISNEGRNAQSSHVQKNRPSSFIIGDPNAITTRKKDNIYYAKLIVNICYTSSIEPTSINEALKDEFWINDMQDELLQF